ncbi:PilC/PilY family type IV pilus protein [Coralloluteibacterium stylophorae]|uniref:Pre-peptidase C-terminal domain-containing protein n=1 Tax=Coralloluteibacterium stylophorae TaxID=1776034 RepID=A0AAP2G196_9GAMM|nr:PilC/PilY family type IV pilus protein [Coralloluteibacterium stylophorae]MBS7458011.1 pre-peptidase C-terminal domain-containing protein [Coralloluteibacterium stylophorae]
MDSIRRPRSIRRASWRSSLLVGACACLATLLAFPAAAGISIPNDPLTTASRVPPNVLFIIDDSGSMLWQYMYNPQVAQIAGGGISSGPTGDNTGRDATYGSDATTAQAMYDQSAATNTLYYNPAITYEPWTTADGATLAGGTAYGQAFANDAFVTHSGSGTSSATVNLAGSTRTFYVPMPGATDPADATQYYRYQILPSGRIVRSRRALGSGGRDAFAGTLSTSQSASSGNWAGTFQINVPAGASNLVISSSGGSCGFLFFQFGCADLYVRLGATPTTSSYTCRSTGTGNDETCLIAAPAAGTYQVRLYGATSFSGVSLSYSFDVVSSNTGESDVGCDTSTTGWGWRECTYATPTGRSEAAERANFATWYSYHRTRLKAAKAAAASAFGELGTDIRVGFRTIWGRGGTAATPASNLPTHAIPIPVNFNDGLFADTGGDDNRTQWYNRLYATNAANGTPLHSALRLAGDYFSSPSPYGPYGPESGADQYACRQNFSILTTDGHWNEIRSAVNGSTGSTIDVGQQDNATGRQIGSPDGASYRYEPTAPYADAYSNTLADVAMAYWKSDLRPDLANIVPVTGGNSAFWQHMVTFGLSIGLTGTTGFRSVAEVPSNFAAWPDPTSNSLDGRKIDDLLHAAVNGRGTFVAAADPDAFTRGLDAALSAITERTGSFSNVAASSQQVTSDTQIFNATFVSGVWSGEVLACPAEETASCTAANARWRASEGIPGVGNRRVYTWSGSAGAAFPTAAQRDALARTGFPSASAAQNVAYLLGDRSLELRNGGALRNRNGPLGDIVHSTPAYVEDTATLFVGANDGMLHAFDARTGAERFAYVPASLDFAALATLSDPAYAHRYFVDGPVVVSPRALTGGRDILVGSLGRGGRGLFALDVTRPGSFGSSDVLWEANGAANPALGLVTGAPLVARLNSGATVAIVGNGINSSSERAQLLVYDLASGTLLRTLDTGQGSAAQPNGLSAPTGWNVDGGVDADGVGTVEHVYAGDMQGNLWKFDLSSANPNTWSIANRGAPLFVATDAGGSRQPITARPAVAMEPGTYRTWVFVGTGRFMTVGDINSTAVQSLYGIVDAGRAVTRDRLTQRRIQVVGSAGGYAVRGFEDASALPPDAAGWFIDLLTPPERVPEGERIVGDAQVYGGTLVVSSILPTAGACQSDGDGYLNALDAFTGTSLDTSFFDLDGDGGFADEVIGGGAGGSAPVGSVNLRVGMTGLPVLLAGRLVTGGSSGNVADLGIAEPRRLGRVSWREVIRE